jgi:tetratricopeptide (TPR) repeat protein
MEIARINLSTAIKQGLHWRGGNEFQTMAQGILRHRIKDFRAVEPYGRDGDGGNDGYSRRLGLYAQIYAPTSDKASARAAARKTVRDFEKLKKKWPRISPIKSYWFVTKSAGSNIHVENALSQIERKHRVTTRFLGLSELTDEALKLEKAQLEELMGFTVGTLDEHSARPALDVLSNIDPQYLNALHLLAALNYAFVPDLCEGLLPGAVDWQRFFAWLDTRGWLVRHGDHLELAKEVAATCQKNGAAQRRAFETWVPALLGHGSIDCVYLAIMPLVMLSRLPEAVRLITHAGIDLVDSGWNVAMLHMWEAFNKPELLCRMTKPERLAFSLARANLLASIGKDGEAYQAFRSAFESRSKWPRDVSRGLMMLNFGVSAHRTGDNERAAQLYADAIRVSRKNGDDWILGRAATNLAQCLLESNPEKASSLLDEAEVAKRRARDNVGLVTVAMVRGLLAAESDQPAEGSRLFGRAKTLISKVDDHDILADLTFNLAKSYGELGRWADAVKEYRTSLREAERREDEYQALRARNGLAEAYFELRNWKACRVECGVLAMLPESTPFPHYRLTGMHGLIVLNVRTNRGDDLDASIARALQFARAADQQDWIGRILVAATFANPRKKPSVDQLSALLDSGTVERKAGHYKSALAAYRAVWAHSVQHDDTFGAVKETAKRLIDAVLTHQRDPAEAVEELKWESSVLMGVGDPLQAARCLEIAAAIAREAHLWSECAAALDQCAVVLAELERPDLSVPLLRDALRIAKKCRARSQERISTANLAECLHRLGENRKALRISKLALALHDPKHDPEGFISALHNLSLVQRALRQRVAASVTLRRCETLARRHSIHSGGIRALMARANMAWEEAAFGKAEKLFRRALREAKRRKISSAAADCCYNLSILLRKRGHHGESLRLLESSPEPLSDPLHSLHRMTLKALLLENVGRPKDALRVWIEAAIIADRIEDPAQQTYCRTRARLIEERPTSTPSSRTKLADDAETLITSIYEASARGKAMQRQVDKAQAFFEKHDLVIYRVRAYQAVADRLGACNDTRSLNTAAQASVASVVMAYPDLSLISFVGEAQVQWLLGLGVSPSRIVRLKTVARRWLYTNFQGIERGTLDMFLCGFDAVEKELRRRAGI